MRSNLITWLILSLYLFLPPVICVGENNHVEVEAGYSHNEGQRHTHDFAQVSRPHAHHHHQPCVDMPVPAETGAKVFVLNAATLLAETVDESPTNKEIILANADSSLFTTSLFSFLRATVLLV